METINQFRGKYSFLSNFYASEVEYDGVYYSSVEHAFQAAKTTDSHKRAVIHKATTPGEAKRIGRGVKLRPDWEEIKYKVMCELVLKKFMYHSELRDQLHLTGNAKLIEGNKWGDTVWGVYNGVGKNWLGRILMDVRSICEQSRISY